jgi:hypothetical protein
VCLSIVDKLCSVKLRLRRENDRITLDNLRVVKKC